MAALQPIGLVYCVLFKMNPQRILLAAVFTLKVVSTVFSEISNTIHLVL